MPDLTPSSPAAGLSLGDVYFTLFRHKAKIITCALLGIGAALTYHFVAPAPYQSEAKLFIRYVMEGHTPATIADDAKINSPDSRGENILSSELEILKSLDLLGEVVDAIGPDKIVPNLRKGDPHTAAVISISRHLEAEVTPRTNVVRIAYEHQDPEIAQSVLRELIERYLKKHVEIHRAVGIVGDFLTHETDQMRSHLTQTEDELRKAQSKIGVLSIEDSRKEFAEQMSRIQNEIFSAEAELAERSADLPPTGLKASDETKSSEAPRVPDEVMESYGRVLARMNFLQRSEQELSLQFTPESERMKLVHAQIAEAESARRKLEHDYPMLSSLRVTLPTPAGSPATGLPDPAADAARARAIEAKIKVLRAQLAEVKTQSANVDEMEATIVELRRKKDLEEANYRRYAASLEQARIDEALGVGHVSNISEIQSPSPPLRNKIKSEKIMAGLAAAGILGGLAWAFIIELFLDRTIRRPSDVERKLHVPLFLSIPVITKSFAKRLRQGSTPLLKSGETDDRPRGLLPAVSPSRGGVSAEEIADSLMPFHDTLRDRLMQYFESQNLTHKPKLVAVTGLHTNAGVTTTAAGLAKSLSETGEGNVLLVDITSQQGSAHQFFKGKICGIDEMLDARNNANVQENLYVVGEHSISERFSRNLPQRFMKLVPKLKASDFDYIIFDMPPVSQISITPRLAGFVDMVLLVLESENTDLELVQRANELLAESKTHIGAVLNKTKNYVPARLHRESLDHV